MKKTRCMGAAAAVMLLSGAGVFAQNQSEAFVAARNTTGDKVLLANYPLPAIGECSDCITLTKPFETGSVEGELSVAFWTSAGTQPVYAGLYLFQDADCNGEGHFNDFVTDGEMFQSIDQDVPPVVQSLAQCTSTVPSQS